MLVAVLVNTTYRPFFDRDAIPVGPLAGPPSAAALARRVSSAVASRTKASKVLLVSPATSWPPLVVKEVREPSPEITGGML